MPPHTGQPTLDRDLGGTPRRPGSGRANRLAVALSMATLAAAVAVAHLDPAVAALLGVALAPVFLTASLLSVAAFFGLANLVRSFALFGRRSALVLSLLSFVAFNWLAFLVWRLVQLGLPKLAA